MKKHLLLPGAGLLASLVLWPACLSPADLSSGSSSSSSSSSILTDPCADHDDDADGTWDPASETALTVADGTVTRISAPGTYRLSGTATGAQIVVEAAAEGLVRLVFDGVDLTSSSGPALEVTAADRVTLILAEGSSNRLTDGPSGEADLDGAVYSRADLTVLGQGGTLAITGRRADGLKTADGLVLRDADLTVTAADDGVVGRDYVVVRGGSLGVTAGGDGVVATNTDQGDRGWISVESGTVEVTSAGDGFQAETWLLVSGGSLEVTSGGGAGVSSAPAVSAHGLKTQGSFDIAGGEIHVSAAEDALHAEGSGTVEDGTLVLAAASYGSGGGQGIKVGTSGTLTLAGGSVQVTRSWEGLAGGHLVLTGGSADVTAADDGLSVSMGTDAMSADDGSTLEISGGTWIVRSAGDGIDVNGSAVQTGGQVEVYGPLPGQANASVDYNGTWTVSGGTLAAFGSSSMSQSLSAASTQNSVLIRLTASRAAGLPVVLKDSAGDEVASWTPAKAWQALVYTSPTWARGTAYTLWVNGTQVQAFTTATTSSVTTVGTSSGGGGRP